ncbi:hypothetical protein [Mycoplasmopsis cynos]|nr:hypothetical protein [Mycoplasmopsis cynos]WAM04636.1 hypothetical protein ONA01_06735 [Mycoplasmopsis cynos]
MYNYDVMQGKEALEHISYHLALNGTTSFIANCNDKFLKFNTSIA